MSQLQALREVPTETAPFNELATRINGLPLEPRCRMCRNDEMRRKVNALLSSGASYAMVLRALEQDNARLDTRDRVTIDSIGTLAAAQIGALIPSAAPRHRSD